MTSPRALLFPACLLFLCTLPATAAPGYRLTPLDDGSSSTMVFDLNRNGELVGMRSIDGVTHAFRWRAGTFTDLHDTIDPGSTYTQAAGINDRSAIVGVTLEGDSFRGFLLRGPQVSAIEVVPGETQVFPFDVNNRGDILVDSVVGGREFSYLKVGSQVQRLEGLPGETGTLHAVAINEHGDVAGNTRTSGGLRALLWQDGTVMNLGVVSGAQESFAYDLNCRGAVVGIVNMGGASHAMRWRNGRMVRLPRLPGEAASGAQSINNLAVIVGNTTITQPKFRTTATVWIDGHVTELDSLVRANDPLRSFVHLQSAEEINDRGDIVAQGVDARTQAHITYFLRFLDN